MKTFALLLVTFVAVSYAAAQQPGQLNDEQRQRVLAATAACMEQEGVTQEAIIKLREGNLKNIDRKAKCFGNCLFEKLGLLANGVPQENVIRQTLGAVFGENKVNAVMQQCNSERGADNCETAFKVYQCYLNNKVGFVA